MHIVSLSGSPSWRSRSRWLLQFAQTRLEGNASTSSVIAVRELPSDALLDADPRAEPIRRAIEHIVRADLLLVATPIYKAAYSGLLKTFLDLLPQDALRGKTVLPLATGGSIAHLLALDYALKPVLSALGARDILDPVYATDVQIPRHETLGYSPLPEVVERIDLALQTLIDRTEEFARGEEAARERDELLARLQPKPMGVSHSGSWTARDVRWSV